MRKFVVSSCVVCVIGLAGPGVFAAAPVYPSKPIRLIVPFPPGGGTDILGRAIRQHLTMALKQNVIVDNRAGGNTVIGSELAARAVPDGHTLLLQIHNLNALPALAAGKPLTVTVASFAPVTLGGVLAHLLVVPPTATTAT